MEPAAILKLDYEDYRELPNDGRRYEIIEGELFMSPAPTPRHQLAILELAGSLHAFARDHALGVVLMAPIDVVLSSHDIVQPDVLFVTEARRSIVSSQNIQGAPDLVVEVLSPTSRRTDERTKRLLYAQFGIPEYWLLDPDLELAKVFRLEGRAYPEPRVLEAERSEELTTELLPGFRLAVARVFGR